MIRADPGAAPRQAYRRTAALFLQSLGASSFFSSSGSASSSSSSSSAGRGPDPSSRAALDLPSVGRDLALRALREGSGPGAVPAGRFRGGGGGGGGGGGSGGPGSSGRDDGDGGRPFLRAVAATDPADPASVGTCAAELAGLAGLAAPPSSSPVGEGLHLRPDFVCPRCGAVPLLLWGGPGAPSASASASASAVRIRPLGRGRTRRRRAARIRARDLAREELAPGRRRGGGAREWGSPRPGPGPPGDQDRRGGEGGLADALGARAAADHGRRRAAAVRLLGQGTRRHCASHGCGHCGHEMRFGGTEVAVRRKRGRVRSAAGGTAKRGRAVAAAADAGLGGRGWRGDAGAKEGKKRKTDGPSGTRADRPGPSPGGGGGDDFLPLRSPSGAATDQSKEAPPLPPPLAPHSFKGQAKAAKEASLSSPLPTKPTMTIIDQKSSNKKKKKKKKSLTPDRKSKSKLMDFLSSLNS